MLGTSVDSSVYYIESGGFTMRYGAVLLGTLLVFAVHAGAAEAGGGCHATAITTGEGVAVEMRGNCFEPTVLNIEAGERVTWTNRDAVPHTVTGAANAWGNYDAIQEDQTISLSFDETGVYPYVCWLHPNMLGAVVVTEADSPIRVSDLVATEHQPTVIDSAATEADRPSRVPMAFAIGGVGLGLVLGLGGSAGWRRWRTRKA